MDYSGGPRPNFLYIGPDKAGSTWIDRILRHHPQVGMGSAKETFYFDRYFHKGEGWYLRHFSKAVGFQVVGEVSHDYLFDPRCCERIAGCLPDVRLMVCLREPARRAFSAYLYMLRQGRPMGTFEAALGHCPELIDHGRYATHLEPYLATFGRERVHLAIFDDLQQTPQAFADALFDFLGLDACRLPGDCHCSENVVP